MTCAVLVLSAATAGAVTLATPAPSVSGDKAAAEAIRALNRGEFSVSFEMKLGTLPSKGSPTGLVRVSADAEGFLTVAVPARTYELEGDFTMRSRGKVSAGDWHHVCVVYSRIRSRAVLYVDGRLQFENDDTFLPETALGAAAADGFSGEVRDLRAWDVALASERLIPAKDAPGKSLYDVRAERQEASVRARLEKEFAANPAAVRTDSLVAYVTDPMSQERVMPYAVPAGADFSGSLDVVVAQDEFESASVVVMALEPVREFTVRMSDLKCAGATIPAKDVDIRLVKRWYRTGGAWFSYFCDYNQRVLTPHLLVYDDALIKVDEIRTRNSFRFDYPEGTRYVDVSDPTKPAEKWYPGIPFNDAKTLQPIANLTEFGRNQQYWINFHATKDMKPGLYTGALDLVADGRTVAKMPVNCRVLPFALPIRGASYEKPDRAYISHLNIQGDISEGRTFQEIHDSALAEFKSIRDHNSLDTSGLFQTPERAALAREAGFPADRVWSGISRSEILRWQELYPSKGMMELTDEDRLLGLRVAERHGKRVLDYWDRNYPDAEKFCLFVSEAVNYWRIVLSQGDQAVIAHKYGWNVFAHAMSERNFEYGGDVQDLQFQTSNARSAADRWHAIDAPVGCYAKPFAAPENPAVQRRMIGFARYKALRMDGNMQHGMKDTNPNQFRRVGGDGNYRCQIMIYPTEKGFLETICWEGVREAYDDIRYATKLKELATPLLHDKNEVLCREARRALVWLENRDGNDASLDMVRMGVIDRILTLKALIAKGGK